MNYKSILFVLMLSLSLSAIADVKVGILAKRGAEKCMKKWGNTGKYLSEKLGAKVKIVPLKFAAVDGAVKSKKIDFLLTNSSMFAVMEKKYKVSAVTTLINSRKGKALKEFGGVIISAKSSPIKKISDIKGKKFMCVKRSSFGGCQMAWREMLAKGVDIDKDVAKLVYGKKHDNVALAVKSGTIDAGTVRTDTLERMQDEGKISLGDFNIINQIKDSFPFVRSTRLYPEWPMAALAHTDKKVVKQITDALVAVKNDSAAAKSAKIVGWTKPLSYGPVKKCMTEIKYGAFK